MKESQQVNETTSQRANINCTLSIVNCKLFSLLSLAIILLCPTSIFAQKDIELDIDVPEKWQIDKRLNNLQFTIDNVQLILVR